MHILIIRGSNVLARPAGHQDGPVPTVEEVESHVVVIESFDYEGMRVATSSTGTMPDDSGWRWVAIKALQDSSEQGDLIGEAMLCGM